MIVQFTPEQISEQWGTIKDAIVASLNKNTEDKDKASNVILQNLLANAMQCWAVIVDNNVNSIMITAFMYTPTGVKSLMIYTMYVYNPTENIDWLSAYEELKKYAVSKGCKNIVAYISNPKLLAILKHIEHIKEIFVTIPIGG